MTIPGTRALRGRLLWYVADPTVAGPAARCFVEDGAILFVEGRIAAVGAADTVLADLPEGCPVDDRRPHLVVPGFVDAHIHFPQVQVVASYGAALLDWLERYTFVEEQRFADPDHVAANARFFLDELLRNGTTSAVVFSSVHAVAAEALHREAHGRNMRMAVGKVMMDRGAPPALLDTAETGYRDVSDQIARWHGRGRQTVAIAPRFALTSTPDQLAAAGRLVREHPDCPVETHIAENLREIEAVRAAYPDDRDYLSIYDRFGLVGPKTLLGHCLHLDAAERDLMAARGAVAVFCPTSNTFLGSGLFDWADMRARGIPVAVATDIGGGTSYSMLATMGEAYKVMRLQGQDLTPDAAFFAVTRGNAAALGLVDRIGSFDIGLEGDAVVLDSAATPAMRHRMDRALGLEEELFVLTTMGDDRAVVATYVMGEAAHLRQPSPGQAGTGRP